MKKSNTKQKKIKLYSEVKVGDIAFENPDAGGQWNNELGKVLWKGSFKEFEKSKYQHTMWDIDEKDEFDPSEYDLIVLQEEYGPTLFNYNNDPSGCVVFK